MARRRGTLLSRFFFRGIAALVPTLLTGYIIFRIGTFVDQNLGQPINRAIGRLPGVNPEKLSWVLGDAIGILLVLLGCMLVGFVVTSFIGRRLFMLVEAWLGRIPLLRAIYPPIKQVSDFFLSESGRTFGRVVVVEYPRRGLYSLGFVTSQGMKDVRGPDGTPLIAVFIPSSPTPMTGYVIMLPESEVKPLDLSVDEALRFTISGGVLVPPSQQHVGGAVPQIPASTGRPEAANPQGDRT